MRVCAELVLLFWESRTKILCPILMRSPAPVPQVLQKVTEKPACLPAPTALEEDADARAYWLVHDVWEA